MDAIGQRLDGSGAIIDPVPSGEKVGKVSNSSFRLVNGEVMSCFFLKSATTRSVGRNHRLPTAYFLTNEKQG